MSKLTQVRVSRAGSNPAVHLQSCAPRSCTLLTSLNVINVTREVLLGRREIKEGFLEELACLDLGELLGFKERAFEEVLV